MSLNGDGDSADGLAANSRSQRPTADAGNIDNAGVLPTADAGYQLRKGAP